MKDIVKVQPGCSDGSVTTCRCITLNLQKFDLTILIDISVQVGKRGCIQVVSLFSQISAESRDHTVYTG